MADPWSTPNDIFRLGDFPLQSGEVLPGAYLAYKTFGDPKNPVIINTTCYAARASTFCQRAEGPKGTGR